MEIKEFDATLGGSEHLPFSANSWKFASSRSIEIAAMTESILRPSKTKLIFQTLPVHMRRRVMSHNCKRLPRKLRKGHLEQLKKSGLAPKQKRPSRKYRRRPASLLEEYNRRQKSNVWLETHIWHAKRFHMTELWGHRLALAPCDKAFRACYRASSAHCLMQDISYYTPIQISGPFEVIKNVFSKITNTACGLSVTAKAYISGNREGLVHLFKPNDYPLGYIGKVSFLWEPGNEDNRNLWLFVHPSQTKEVKHILELIIPTSESPEVNGCSELPNKRRKIGENITNNIKLKVLAGYFNRFRLTGPNSHTLLIHTLKCVDDEERIKKDKWGSNFHNVSSLKLDEKLKYWNNLITVSSPSQLPPRLILGLVVKDPRLSRPMIRTKAKVEKFGEINIEHLISIPQSASLSPIWNTDLHEVIKENSLTNGQFIEHVTKTQLVPGAVFEDDPVLQTVPIVLIQRPGSQNPTLKKLGYGCGWDILVPSGYAMKFWQTFIMFGARTGGLRETESLAFEMGECYLPPDSEAGKIEEQRLEAESKERYFKRPPSKRVNYIKLGINSPFVCQWNLLLSDWCNQQIEKFFVLRDKHLLRQLQDSLERKSKVPSFENSASCLVPVYLHMEKKGSVKRHALICLPKSGDNTRVDTLKESQHVDSNEKIRKLLRIKRNKAVKHIRRKNNKMKKKGIKMDKSEKQTKKGPSEYVKKIRELWLPTKLENVRCVCSREIMGYLSQGAFSFSEAKSCGVGYIAYNSLSELLCNGLNYVLVRNTTSQIYRTATIQIVNSL